MNDENLIAAADAFGTPLYVFDEASLRDRVALLEETLPARALLCREGESLGYSPYQPLRAPLRGVLPR